MNTNSGTTAKQNEKQNLRGRISRLLSDMSLTAKIRLSYLVVSLPLLVFAILCLVTMQTQTKRYDQLIEAAGRASSFSLDFKSDFDYETYLVIVESKSFEECSLREMLSQAQSVVESLSVSKNLSAENTKRLEDIRKYLINLGTYTDRIEANLKEGNQYESNMEIWENDVQIVTALVRETMLQFIYYEIQDMIQVRDQMRTFYTGVMTFIGIALVVLLLLMALISVNISKSITSPVLQLSKVTERVAGGDLSVRADITGGAELGVLATSLDEMIVRIQELLSQVRTEQESLRTAELELLQAQINPHFLYNTLDTIVWLAEGGDQQRVVGMVKSLSEFFRTSLGQGREIVTVRDELRHVGSYLEIQQIRYQDILQYKVEVPEELGNVQIPKITLQPIVENALYHGIKNVRGGGTITVTGKAESGCVYLYIEDDGAGIAPERLKQINERLSIRWVENEKANTSQDEEGQAENMAQSVSAMPAIPRHQKQAEPEKSDSGEIFGLYNVNERIRLKFGQRYGLYVESEQGKGTRVTVLLPA
ncbi:MAG: sensor histidine kinase [Lachnospiraceae bacterium]|nr:sensor histidine kinase [Lachnospiraceae bacterium]